MNARGAVFAVAACLAMAACGSLDGRNSAPLSDGTGSTREILVMLQLPPPHFRPDVSYATTYESGLGRGARRRIAEELADQFRLTIVTTWPMPALGVDCFVMALPRGDVAAQVAEQIALDPRVESAQPMHRFEVLAHNDPLYPLQPGARLWRLADVHKVATGRNVRVAEVDTGVEVDHPDLRGQIALTRNFVDGSPYAAETHGTAVAGIIAARADDGIGIAGVAPAAKLLVLRACSQASSANSSAVCTSFTLAKALQFAVDQNVNVINMSLGGPPDRLLGRLLDVAMAHGIAVVAATDPHLADGGFPASHPGVLSVTTDDATAAPSGVLAAPGKDIPTSTPNHTWSFVTGSSYAAAHVTGVVALLLELAPELRAERLRDALIPIDVAATAPGGHLRVDACTVVARTTGSCACACAVAHDTRSVQRR
jgi:hypothetical protein